MKLWLLKAHEIDDFMESPWSPVWDTAQGFVIRAKTEQDARRLANKHGGDENLADRNVWLDPNFTTCTELTLIGEEGIVLRDFHYG
jgi:hypothetical protein